MKRFLFHIMVLLTLAACSDKTPQPAASERVLLAYLSANNNLSFDIMRNVQWMYQSLAGMPNDCKLLIYYKPYQKGDVLDEPTILEYHANGLGKINGHTALTEKKQTVENILAQAVLHSPEPGNSVDPKVMETNLKRMKELAPARNYGLILGSHATGWLPSSDMKISTMSFGEDDGMRINLPEMAQVLNRTFPNKDLDFILFDACMMGNAEVCYELRNATHYCIVSAIETPAVGFPYHRILPLLYEKETNYAAVCKSIVEYNKENGLWGAYAAINCTKMQQLADAVRNALAEKKDVLKYASLKHIQQYGISTYEGFSFDILDTFRHLNKGNIPENLAQSISETVVAKDCIDDTRIPPFNQLITDRNRFCGLGMYLPYLTPGKQQWDNYYENLEWFSAAGWNELKPFSKQ